MKPIKRRSAGAGPESRALAKNWVTNAKIGPEAEAIGGGARINAPASVKVAVNGTYPAVASNNARTGWIATGRETPEEPGNWQIVAYAVCAEL